MAKRATTVARGASAKSKAHLQERSIRKDGWTPDRRATFFRVLAETANVTLAAETAGMSRETAYRQRRNSAPFEKAWQEALKSGIDRLEMMVLERALNGTEKTIPLKGGKVKTVRVFSERMIIHLLKAHKPEVYGVAPFRARFQTEATPPPVMDAAEARARMLKIIDEVAERLGDEA